MDNHDLVDAIRRANPPNFFTHFHTTPTGARTSTHIDHILTSTDITTRAPPNLYDLPLTDHRGILIDLQLPGQTRIGNGYWHLSPSALQSEYSRNVIHHLIRFLSASVTSPQWDTLKRSTRLHLQRVTQVEQRRRRTALRSIQKTIADYHDLQLRTNSPYVTTQLREYQQTQRVILEAKAEELRLRKVGTVLDNGNAPSASLYRQLRTKRANDAIRSLIRGAEEITDL